MPRMDASQGVSLGTTKALSPDFDFSSLRFTTNGGGDGFSPARPVATATGVHTDRLDLATVSFSFTTGQIRPFYAPVCCS